jgi:hypothetical protein
MDKTPLSLREFIAGNIVVMAIFFSGMIYVLNDESTLNMHQKGFELGYKQGKLDALRTNPVSVDLEHACTSIWISEQITEQHRREQERKKNER